MKLSMECLEAAQVDTLLQGNLTPEEFEATQDHLERCEKCRTRVEATIGPADWWNDVQSVLLSSPTGSHLPRRDSSTEAEPKDTTTAKLLDLLGPTDDPNMLGRIGPYEIVGVLGQGGMGAVFKGFDRSLNRFVAIKMLLPHLAASGAARKRFAREGQAVAAVVDDHVMAIYCVDEWQGVPYLVMTYSRGVSLQKRLSENGPLDVREILRIGMQAARGLAAAHAQGIVHRDIKPGNIFLDRSVERVQLMDFGLARAVDDASLTRSGTLAGTPQYMSPEQARAETVDHRSDLFSLGSVMYAMCTGHAPFRADSSYGVLRLITDNEPRPIREINPDIPEWLCTIIKKLMAKQAGERFDSAQKVAKLLEDCLAHVQQPSIANLPSDLVPTASPLSSGNRWRKIGVVSALAAVGLLIVSLLQLQQPNQPSLGNDENDGGGQLAATSQDDAREAGIAKLTELLEKQRLREKSLRQLSLSGSVRQYERMETNRQEAESNEEFIKRYTSVEQEFDSLGPFPMLIERDYTADSGHIKFGDLDGNQPISFREWFFKQDVFTQLMGVSEGHCQATITKKPADELRQPWSGWIRADVYAFRPIFDHELSVVLEKAAFTPGQPDLGGRPLFHLERKHLANQPIQWIATFLHQEPSEVNGHAATEQHWCRVFWEQHDDELLITRVDELSVVGGVDSMPLRVALVDDYRAIDGVKIPHRVRTFMFGNPSGMLGAEFVASDVKVNDGVVMPTELQIPVGTSVRDELTGKKYRQRASEPESNQDSPKSPTDSAENTTINPDVPAEGKPVDKDTLLNELRERDRKFSRRTVELERTWDTLISPRSMAAEYRFQSMKFGQPDPGIPDGLPENYQQPHRIRYLWTGQGFDSTFEILADLETAIHPEYGQLEPRFIESDCFNYQRRWNRDQEIFSHSSDIAKLNRGKKAWEYLIPSGFGFSHSILSVSNAVEVDSGYVLKGLVSLPSATIGNRKNCFEIHLDKELILRKAVIQYHVYDFVIVTFGRSEFKDMPPLAKNAFVSIHHIGQDEKRFGDVGNYKYELISLSDELSKAEYDLRVNFEIPKGTKLSVGLNFVDVNLDGLPGVKQIERSASTPSAAEQSPDGGVERKDDKVPQPEQAPLGKTLQQLQGKWRLTRQIAPNGDEGGMPKQSIWEFKGDRIIVRDGGPGGALLIEVDDSQSPANVKFTIEIDEESGLGLVSVDGDKAIFSIGKLQKAPQPESRPQQLQWVAGFDYMELTRMNPGENIVPSEPKALPLPERETSTNNAATPIATKSLVPTIDHSNARHVVETYVASARAGDVAKAASLAKNSPADPNRIRELPEFLGAQPLTFDKVYVNDRTKPTQALAVSGAVKVSADRQNPDGRRDGIFVFTLESTDGKWFVIDVDFKTESDAEEHLEAFLIANLNSIKLPPLPSFSTPIKGSDGPEKPSGIDPTNSNSEFPGADDSHNSRLNQSKNNEPWMVSRVVNSFGSAQSQARGRSWVESQRGRVALEPEYRVDGPWYVAKASLPLPGLLVDTVGIDMFVSAKSVVLDCEEIHDLSGMRGLTELESLYVNQHVHDVHAFDALRDLPKLKRVILSKWTGLSQDQIASIAKSLEGVEVIEEDLNSAPY